MKSNISLMSPLNISSGEPDRSIPIGSPWLNSTIGLNQILCRHQSARSCDQNVVIRSGGRGGGWGVGGRATKSFTVALVQSASEDYGDGAKRSRAKNGKFSSDPPHVLRSEFELLPSGRQSGASPPTSKNGNGAIHLWLIQILENMS